jgi:hypothetical protein
VLNLDIAWGWKDPRNIFLLPLWLDIFPDAKIIHVFRNGVDVAYSLAQREKSRIHRVVGGKDSFSVRAKRQSVRVSQRGPLLYGFQQLRRVSERLGPLSKYDQLRVQPCLSIEKGFELWCAYVKRAFEHIENIEKRRLMNIKYEDFVSSPEHYIEELQHFCALGDWLDVRKKVRGIVDPTRAYAFQSNPSLRHFYNKVMNNYWMEKAGYNSV